MDSLAYRRIPSPLGPLLAGVADGRLVLLHFDSSIETSHEFNPGDAEVLALLESQLSEYFARTRREFTVPLAPTGTTFQQRVWNALREIPFGTTRTYAEQATALGDLKAIRAVARANGQNPIAIVIPCHRVIGSDGSLTGYAGGLARKQKLLELEGSVALTGDLFPA